MSVLNEDQLLGAPAGSSQYQIQRSIRLNAPDSAYLSRTPASAGNRKTWTWSGWVKKNRNGASYEYIFDAGATANFGFSSDFFYFFDNAVPTNYRVSTQVFRDPSAWYHFVVAFDSDNATAQNRLRVYVNGAEITAWSTNNTVALSTQTQINNNVQHSLGGIPGYSFSSTCLADIHFIDGQALTPSSFGETDATTGQWIHKAYTGTYGTNGFKLNFSNNSAATATTLGADSSGNGNNWTPNNLSVTAGAGNDSLVDTPTSYGTDTGVGGEVRGNYCTLNPLDAPDIAASNGNLDLANAAASNSGARGTFTFPSAGKWYYEGSAVVLGSNLCLGFARGGPASANATASNTYYLLTNSSGVVQLWVNGSGSTNYSGVSVSAGSVLKVAYDSDNSRMWFGVNNVWLDSSGGTTGNPATGANPTVSSLTGSWIPSVSVNTSTISANFGQRPFAYTAPSGFKALCDTNLPAPTIVRPSTVMDVKLYTGNSGTQTLTGLGFSPDLVWIKNRSFGNNHIVTDIVRGANNTLYTNTTEAAATNEVNGYLSSFTSDGFTVTGGSTSTNNVNNSSYSYAAWCWDAGSSTVTNTAGTIQSSVRANASAGFSIVTYTGIGGTQTVGHGLGVVPSLIIVKCRSNSDDWAVKHVSLTAGQYLYLNSTAAAATTPNLWNTTNPTSSVFTVASDSHVNGNTLTYVAYCFAPVAGYSAFGSYTGNGSTTDTAPFVYTGFRPRWILLKDATVSGDSWIVFDSARDAYNVSTLNLFPNLPSAENNSTNTRIDILSSGFKIRCANATGINANNSTMVFAAFAEFPFQYARAR